MTAPPSLTAHTENKESLSRDRLRDKETSLRQRAQGIAERHGNNPVAETTGKALVH